MSNATDILGEPLSIESVTFHLTSDEEIQATAAAEINTTAQFEKSEPISGGLFDLRMGTISYTYKCASCNKDVNNCPGHHGFYRMNSPQPKHITAKYIPKNMDLICIHCFRYILDPSLRFDDGRLVYPEYYADGPMTTAKGSYNYRDRLNFIHKKKTGKSKKPNYCDYCNNVQEYLNAGNNLRNFTPSIIQPEYKVVKKKFERLLVLEELSETGNGNKKYVSSSKMRNQNPFSVLFFPRDIKERFEMLSYDEIIKHGFAFKAKANGNHESVHPKNFVDRILVIPPVNMRHINRNNKEIFNNFITSALETIIVADRNIDPSITYHNTGLFEKQLKDVINVANKYADYISSSGADESEVSSIFTSLKGKKGILRNRLLGKLIGRVFRCVITCDVDTNVDTISIPLVFAKSMHFKEAVTQYNIEQMQQYVNNRNNYPGCSKIKIATTGKCRDNDGKYKLQIGDKVYRNIIDGDTLPICRFPSLFLTSILCAKVVVNKSKSGSDAIGMNVIICPLLNADFDGDAIFGFYLVNEEARTEYEYLAKIERNFVTGETGQSNFGQAQDTIAGCGFLTMNRQRFSRIQAMKIMNSIPIGKPFDQEFYSGRELFSMVMPAINLKIPSPFFQYGIIKEFYKFDPEDEIIEIVDGKLISGIVCGSVIKPSINSIYHIIYNYYGPNVALRTISYHQTMIKNFIMNYGITLDYSSFLIGDESREMMRVIQTSILHRVDEINLKLMNGEISPPSGVSMSEYVENLTISTFQSVGSKYFGAILASVNPMDNWLILMMLMGSKGALSNLCNTLAPYGQIYIDQQRTPQWLDYVRSNIWSYQFDLSPESRGYVKASLMEGINLSEQYHSAREARNNIITKSLVTAEAGTEGRNASKNFESSIIDNRLFLTRNNGAEILQFNAGDDCTDYKNLFPSKYRLFAAKIADIEKSYPKEMLPSILAEHQEYLQNCVYRERTNLNYMSNDRIASLLNVPQIISILVPRDKKLIVQDLSMAEKCEIINEFCDNLHYCRFSRAFKGKPCPPIIRDAFTNSRILIRSEFTTELVSQLNHNIITTLFAKIYNQIVENLVQPGMAYGSTIGLTLTSPLTQYLIDAHHKSASGGTSRDGIRDFKSTINLKAPDKSNTNRTYIYVLPEYEQDKDTVSRLADFIGTQYLRDYLIELRVLYENVGECITYPEDKSFVKDGAAIKKIVAKNMLNFMFRVVLDRKRVVVKHVDVNDISFKLDNMFGNKIKCIYSSDLNSDIVIHMYFDKEFTFDLQDKKSTSQAKMIDKIETFIDYFINSFIINNFKDLNNTKVVSRVQHDLLDGQLVPRTIYYVEADGINLHDVFLINIVDRNRTTCNHIEEIYKYCGFAVTRNRIIDILNGTFISLKLLITNYIGVATIIMERGKPFGMNINGSSEREPDNYLLRSTYKSPVDAIADGAMNGATNRIISPSTCLIMGQMPRVGSRYNKLICNPDFIAKMTSVDEVEDIL